MINIKTMAAACGLMMLMNTAAAENINLAQINTDVNGSHMRVELWGDQLSSGYADNLLLLIKDSKGNVKSAFHPSVTGGYNCMLTAVQVKNKGQQLMLAAAQGDWSSKTEYRLIDISDVKDIKEIFTFKDNLGVVKEAEIDGRNLKLTMLDDDKSSMQIDEGLFSKLSPKRLQTDYKGLSSLTNKDIDSDGIEELLSVQKISADKQILADVGAVWKQDENGAWQNSSFTVLVAGNVAKNNTINDGYENKNIVVLPKKIIMPQGEATYPVVLCKNNRNVQDKINTLLAAEYENYLNLFYAGEADMAFNVLRADDNLLTVQLISGKNKFVHHHVNIDPQTGERIKLDDILNTEDKDLLPLLNLLNTNENIEFTEGLPAEWYLTDGKLYLILNICGQEEVAGYAVGNLHKFVKDKKWLSTDWSVSNK